MSFSKRYENIIDIVREDVERLQNNICCIIPENEGVEDRLRDYFASSQKHIRAVLSFLYLRAYSLDIDEKQIVFQSVIELVHNGSLIHDDVIDKSDTRRGKKSFNAEFGEHLSVIAGDYVLSFALKQIYELKSFEILDIFAQTFSKMCKGEISQYNSKYIIPTIDEYIEKSYNKTGALFEAAISGAEFLAAGKVNPYTKDFAINFGIAFQIKNDIKNILQNKPDNDIDNGIYTAAMIYAGSSENLAAGIEKAKILLDTYIRRAKIQLEYMPENIYKQTILDLLELLNDDE